LTEEARDEPLLRVLTPDATPEEVAAVVAVFAAMGGGVAAPEKPRSVWAAPAQRMRTTLPNGPGAWRASALPR
jgi:hypothetical protein